jgi:hypothetical protein
MRKILTALVAAATIGVAAITTSSSAQAWWGWGPAVAGGVIAGAIVGGALAARPYYYPYYYGPYPYPYYGPRCRRVWNGYTWVPACY